MEPDNSNNPVPPADGLPAQPAPVPQPQFNPQPAEQTQAVPPIPPQPPMPQPGAMPPQQFPQAGPPPVYGGPTQQAAKASKLPIVIAAVVGLLVIGGGFIGYKAVSGKKPASKSLLAEPKAITKDTKVGAEADMDGLKLTVSAVDKKTQLGDYDTPATGHVFMIATVRVENKTDHNVSVTPYDFKFHTTQGQLLNGSDVYNSSQKLPDGELAPGGTAQGLVLFEVPTDQTGTGALVEYAFKYLPEDYTKSELDYKASFSL